MLRSFRDLHKTGRILLLPNAWNVSSAVVFERAGFQVVGTTSWGIAASQGFRDGEVMRFDEQCLTAKRIVERVAIPVTMDIEAGYSDDPRQIAEHVEILADLGVVGINIEDSLKNGQSGLRDIQFQCAIIETIKSYLGEKGKDIFINARIDTFLSGCPADRRVDDTINRGNAFVRAGAECVFVPGATDPDQIRTLCKNIAAPINVMALPGIADAGQLQELGVARLSIGNGAFDAELAHLFAEAKSFLNTGRADAFSGVVVPDLKLTGSIG